MRSSNTEFRVIQRLFTAATVSVLALSYATATQAQSQDDTSSTDYSAVRIVDVTSDLDERERGQRGRYRDDFSRQYNDRDLDRALDRLDGRIRGRLDKADIPVVDESGEGVLDVYVTVTDLESSRPTLGALSENPSLSYQGSVSVGGADVQIEVRDSQTGEQVTVIEDSNYDGSLNDGRQRISTWADADRSFNSASRNLTNYLEDEIEPEAN